MVLEVVVGTVVVWGLVGIVFFGAGVVVPCDVRVVVVVRLGVVVALGRLSVLVEGRKTWLVLRTLILLRTSRGMVEVVAVARWWALSLGEVMVVREATEK